MIVVDVELLSILHGIGLPFRRLLQGRRSKARRLGLGLDDERPFLDVDIVDNGAFTDKRHLEA